MEMEMEEKILCDVDLRYFYPLSHVFCVELSQSFKLCI
jgi:hypothetical protein